MIDPTRIVGEYLRTSVASPATTTLNGDITAAATSITLASGAALAGYEEPIVVKVDSEYFYGSISSNTFTADLGSRGAFNTTAATHSTGATVSVANLYMLCGTRIYPDRLPDAFANTTPTILFRVRGGTGNDARVPVGSYSMEFFCYGGTDNYDDAMSVYRALNDRLHDVTMADTASGTIMAAHEEVAPQNATEPDTEYPRVFGAFNIMLRS